MKVAQDFGANINKKLVGNLGRPKMQAGCIIYLISCIGEISWRDQLESVANLPNNFLDQEEHVEKMLDQLDSVTIYRILQDIWGPPQLNLPQSALVAQGC